MGAKCVSARQPRPAPRRKAPQAPAAAAEAAVLARVHAARVLHTKGDLDCPRRPHSLSAALLRLNNPWQPGSTPAAAHAHWWPPLQRQCLPRETHTTFRQATSCTARTSTTLSEQPPTMTSALLALLPAAAAVGNLANATMASLNQQPRAAARASSLRRPPAVYIVLQFCHTCCHTCCCNCWANCASCVAHTPATPCAAHVAARVDGQGAVLQQACSGSARSLGCAHTAALATSSTDTTTQRGSATHSRRQQQQRQQAR
jgi:hypothetical protein